MLKIVIYSNIIHKKFLLPEPEMYSISYLFSTNRKTASRTMSEAGCEGECCPIYGENPHIKRREHKNEPILGSSGQFCSAFYHVNHWIPREHFCLDENRCIIAKRKRDEQTGWNIQPLQVIAVAKFEDKDGSILYEAKYSNCIQKETNNHAEDFFKEDIEDSNGVLNQLVQDNPNGTITLYITYQPCHKSIVSKNTDPNQSCCNILEDIVTRILRAHGRKIDLCVKATHAHSSLSLTREQGKRKGLRQNAVEGTKKLMRIEGISVSGMTHEDWAYLFSLTECFFPRQVLDNDVKQILNEINLS